MPPPHSLHNVRMGRFLAFIIANAVGIYLAVLIVPGIEMRSFGPEWWQHVLSYALIGLIFGIVNAIVGTFLRSVGCVVYVLTLGLISFIVNAALLMLTAWITKDMTFGLSVNTFFWDAIFGAIIVMVVSTLVGGLLKSMMAPSRTAAARRF